MHESRRATFIFKPKRSFYWGPISPECHHLHCFVGTFPVHSVPRVWTQKKFFALGKKTQLDLEEKKRQAQSCVRVALTTLKDERWFDRQTSQEGCDFIIQPPGD